MGKGNLLQTLAPEAEVGELYLRQRKETSELENRYRKMVLLFGIVLLLMSVVVPPCGRIGSLKHASFSVMQHTCVLGGIIIGMGSLWGLILILPIVVNWRSELNEMTVAQLLQNISTSTPLIGVVYWIIAFSGGLALGYYVRVSSRSRRFQRQQE